ncbi:MAG: SUMF1/EgtB/PvdO family nonheme iron enzyme, partial [Treponema sp.]|nr:SUMF1/EgtB/PvdO family nonheme iron enzyme [Treponema sp.]
MTKKLMTLALLLLACAFALSAQEKPTPQGMVQVLGGTFRMGSPSGGYDDERPVRVVTVSPFFMDVYPVTQKEWCEVTGSNAPNFKGDDFPVTDVNWFEAVEFA